MNYHSYTKTPRTSSEDVLYLWDDRTLYYTNKRLSPSGLTTSADMLVAYFDGHTHLADVANRCHSSRLLLIKAGHSLDFSKTNLQDNYSLAIIYLDPFRRDADLLCKFMKPISSRVFAYHCDENAIISSLKKITSGELNSQQARTTLNKIVRAGGGQIQSHSPVDSRIVRAVELLKRKANQNLTLEQLARAVHLSESRLCKLFKKEIGVPIRRYRMWHRLYICSVAYATGYSLLDSALLAGFSSQSHYTTVFRKLLGMSPSEVLRRDNILKAVADELTLERFINPAASSTALPLQ
ncbi:hypothetical protein NBRC116494_06250 [Aurantivibrio plasticivorans]